MLLNPGAPFEYNGRRLAYPDIRLVYWAGGNPFHHHQDIARLQDAFARPDTIAVPDSAWTAPARPADIDLPATTSLERDDIGAPAPHPRLVALQPIHTQSSQARQEERAGREEGGRTR